MEKRFEEIVKTLAGGGLLGFHSTNLSDAGGELSLERDGWNWDKKVLHDSSVEVWLRALGGYSPKMLSDKIDKFEKIDLIQTR